MSAMFRGVVIALACVVGSVTPAAADLEKPTEAQKQAIYAKASVVRVVGFWEVTFTLGSRSFKEYVGGMGSGFFISADGFVATNAHVVEDIKNGEARAKEKAFSALYKKLQQQAGADMARMDPTELRELLDALRRSAKAVANSEIVMPDGTKLPYVVRAFGAPVGEGKDVAIIKVDIKNAPNLSIGDSEKVSIQDKVLAIGYPGAADMQGLLDPKSQLEATVTDGAVSAIKRTTDGEPVLQVSVPITHGNSGGPAINERGEVIGLATFGSRGEVQGFNFLVAASTVKKFVREAKADTKPSKTITVWRKGLDDMWSGDLDSALEHFDEVMVLFPTHSEVPRLRKHTQQMKKEGKGRKPEEAKAGEAATGANTGGGGGAGAAVAVIIVLALVGGAIFAVMKMKKPAHAGVPGHVVPHGHHPQQPMMGGRAPGPAPVARTVAIGQQQQHAPVAKTAFASSMVLANLSCTRGLLYGQHFTLGPQGILIGRQPGVAQIVINDSRASGKHVWIGFENGQLYAIDQGTTNGTFVNDVRNGRISKAPLKDGDVVIVAEPDVLTLQLKLA
jgi:serine protease Do